MIKTCHGSRPCGAVIFDLSGPVTCDCSRRRRLGAALAFTLLSGDGAMSEYLFNKRIVPHGFRATCGIEPFAIRDRHDGIPIVAINLNGLRAHPHHGAAA